MLCIKKTKLNAFSDITVFVISDQQYDRSVLYTYSKSMPKVFKPLKEDYDSPSICLTARTVSL